jgi:ATP-dependent DNA helicase RecQ
MTKQKREDAQEMWMNNTIPIIVATTAFGMGIDKADVGLIVNYDAPEHIEAYYQEAGRGGRNGNQAYSFILYNNTDINRLEDSIGISYPDEKYLQHVYQCIVEYLQIPISAEPDKYYPFDLKDFCEKFKLDAYTASSAVKLLEQEGLWTTTESVFTPPTLFFIINRAELDETIATYPKLAYAVTNLLRLYGSLFQYPTPIRINTIARQLKIKNEEADEILKQLQLLGIADYTTPSHGPQLYFHHYRVDSRQLIIDTKWINILKKRHVDRTNAILNYLSNTEQCRTRLLLQYFGEHKKEDCRHCDICAKKQPSHLTSSISIQTAILQYLASADEIQIHELLRKLAVGSEMEILNTLRAMADEKILTIQGNGIIKRL